MQQIAHYEVTNAGGLAVGPLAAQTHPACVRIVRGAGRNRQHAGSGSNNLAMGRSGRCLSGGSCTGDDDGNNESANEKFHDKGPFVLSLKY